MIKYNESLLTTEKDVEHFFWNLLKHYFPNGEIVSSYKTDGIFIDEKNKIKMLLEIKYDLDLKKSTDKAKILIQSLFYLKKFELKGEKVPKTIFAGDKNEVFIVHTNALLKYLDYDIDWNIAPSQAYNKLPKLLIDIAKDEQINPFVFDINNKGFNFESIKNKILDLNLKVKRLIKITDDNIQRVFTYFLKNVLGKNKLTVNEVVNLFIDLIINSGENYLHPKKKNTLYSKSLGYLKVNEKSFVSFFEHFDGEQYTVREKENLVSVIDRLVEDETRRKQGEFFTPKIWVDEAHKMISEEFGEDWKEKYIVWDCAWGTGNLTRDYKFKELYCSTLNSSDIETANQMKINPEAVKFQYDFLNDDLELLKEPDYAPGLYNAIKEGKEILFLINPPYGESKGNGVGKIEKGVSKTNISTQMVNDNIGYSTRQLYAQFLYRIIQLQKINTNIKIGLFSPTLFMSSSTYKSFRELFFNNFSFKNGFIINSNNFADVKQWSLSFTIFDKTVNDSNIFFNYIRKEINDELIIINNDKLIYNLDNSTSCSDYIRKFIKNEKLVETLQLSSALKPKQSNLNRIIPNSIGYILLKSNKVNSNISEVALYTSASSNRGGVSLIKKNFLFGVLLFSARKSIKSSWINDKDEYIAPSEEVQNTEKYKQYNNDAIIYSLFNTSSNQSSMRQVEYKDKLWDIKNEFFWLSKEEMMELADTHYFDELYQDARSSDERFVYKLLNGKLSTEDFNEVGLTYTIDNKPILSSDAQELLDMSKDLIKKSFEYRSIMHEEYPEYHLNTWDAGWYQIKKILNAYMKDEYKIFVEKYKKFEDRLRPQVYEFDMLLLK